MIAQPADGRPHPTRTRSARTRRRLDLPTDGDGSGRFLPWIIGLMVYLAALALAGMMALQGAIERWDSALAGTLTVQLPAGAGRELDAALALLRATPGVTRAEPLDAAANAALLERWLGPGLAANELRLPILIDLRVDPARPLDHAALAQRLAAVAPTARLDDRHGWLDRLYDIALTIELIAGAIVILVTAAAVMSIVFATRTGLAIHHGTVEVLHLIGARDTFIAAQFQWPALRLGLRGGLIGLVPAVLTLLALGQVTGGMTPPSSLSTLPGLTLAPWHWIVLLMLPVAAGCTALITARATVLRALARMP
jgi:cell division transport system permease protein